jgi:hypothetical protein
MVCQITRAIRVYPRLPTGTVPTFIDPGRTAKLSVTIFDARVYTGLPTGTDTAWINDSCTAKVCVTIGDAIVVDICITDIAVVGSRRPVTCPRAVSIGCYTAATGVVSSCAITPTRAI